MRGKKSRRLKIAIAMAGAVFAEAAHGGDFTLSVTPIGSMTLSKPDVRFCRPLARYDQSGDFRAARLWTSADWFSIDHDIMWLGAATDFFAPRCSAREWGRIHLEGWRSAKWRHRTTLRAHAAGTDIKRDSTPGSRIYSAPNRIMPVTGSCLEKGWDGLPTSPPRRGWRWHDFQLILGLRLEFGSSAETEIR